MTDTILYCKNANFVNSLKFKIPISAHIINIKVRNINFLSKIISERKISVYGNYEILISYNIRISSNRLRRRSICRKVNFYKTIKLYDISEYTSYSNIKSEITYITSPKCYYSIDNKPHSKHSIGITNFCKVYILSSITLTLKEKNTIEKKNLLPKEEIHNKLMPTNETTLKKRFIEATTIIGSGSTDFIIEKEIDIPEALPSIWTIDNVEATIKLTDISPTMKKIIVSGFIDINVNYKTLMTSFDNVSTGKISHIETNFPFSTPIDLITDDNINLKKSDVVKVVTAKCLAENHILSDSLIIPSEEVVYNKITTQLLLQIKVMATRKEKIFIK